MCNEKTLLITGGTGSFGKSFLRYCEENSITFKKIILFSRDELKHYTLQKEFPKTNNLDYVIGDVRDKERLNQVLSEANIIIHAAAMKHVPICEENPEECYKTNVLGAKNLIESFKNSINAEQLIAISTDKAVAPNNVYGNSKKEAEKLFLEANSENKKISVVRYGNVFGASGSIVPAIVSQQEKGTISITDERMMRYFLSSNQAVEAVLHLINTQKGGEILIPKCKLIKIIDLAKFIAPNCNIQITGIRKGEKLTENLFSEEEQDFLQDSGKYFVLLPNIKKATYINNFQPEILTSEEVQTYLQQWKR